MGQFSNPGPELDIFEIQVQIRTQRMRKPTGYPQKHEKCNFSTFLCDQ